MPKIMIFSQSVLRAQWTDFALVGLFWKLLISSLWPVIFWESFPRGNHSPACCETTKSRNIKIVSEMPSWASTNLRRPWRWFYAQECSTDDSFIVFSQEWRGRGFHVKKSTTWHNQFETIMISHINSIGTSRLVYRIHQKQQAAPNLSVVHHDLGLGILRINEDLVIVESCLVIDTASLIDTASPLAEYHDFGHGVGRNPRGSLRIPRGKPTKKIAA